MGQGVQGFMGGGKGVSIKGIYLYGRLIMQMIIIYHTQNLKKEQIVKIMKRKVGKSNEFKNMYRK